LDLPRIEDAGLTAAMWSVTTNPARTRASRWRTVQKNFRRLRRAIESTEGRCRIASTHAEYVAAREAGAHVCLLSIQGGNALDAAPDGNPCPDPAVLRVTLVHLPNSSLGESS